jgi:hypothetical protein
MIEHEMNGSKMTTGIGEYIKGKIADEKLKVDHLVMAESQWKKLCRMYAEDGMKEGEREFITLPAKLAKISEHEIHFRDKKGEVVAKLVGLER